MSRSRTLPGSLSPQIGHGAPQYEPPKYGLDQYGGYTKASETTYNRTRVAEVPSWNSQPLTMQFMGAPNPNIIGRAIWRPPTFDLRPDLKHAAGNQQENTQPIWKDGAFGAGLGLYVFITNPSAVTEELRIYSIQLGHPWDSSRVVTLQQAQEITSDFFDGNLAVILRWSVPGYRYWRVDLRMDQVTGALNNVGTPLTVSASVY
jgi:hypothetical protein